MRTTTTLIALAMLAPVAAGSKAQTPVASAPLLAADAARKFGAREAIQDIALSPDGKHYAVMLATPARAVTLAVGPVDQTANPKGIVVSDQLSQQLLDCAWANDARLVCQLYKSLGKGVGAIGFTRQMIINANDGSMKPLSAGAGYKAVGYMQNGGTVIDWYGDPEGRTILATRAFVASEQIGSNIDRSASGLGVERIDPSTMRRSTIEQPKDDVVQYITDGIGNVRIKATKGTSQLGQLRPGRRYYYRLPAQRDWRPLSVVSDDGGFDPVAVDPTLNVAYGFDKLDGRQALYKVTLDETLKRELVFARPDVDVDWLVRIGRKKRVVGVGFTTDRQQIAYFDPALKKLQAALTKAVPHLPLVYITDSSADESKLLIRLASDNDPGRYAVFDRQTHRLDMLLDVRPDLTGIALASVQSVTFPAGDGTAIPGYLTLPPQGKPVGAIVMPHGGPAARDEWGFDWLAQFFAARGFAVLQPNYRGSTGYGVQWFADNGFKSWRLAIGDVNDAGRWLVKQGYATPDKLAIVGWSYGGYAALQAQVLDPDLFKAAVAIAPVTDFATLKAEWVDFTNHDLVERQIGDGPHITQGSPARNAAAFKAPVLMFHGDRDQNVGIGESRLMLDKLRDAGKRADLVEFPGLDHQLDDSEARAQMLSRADAFLRSSLGIATP